MARKVDLSQDIKKITRAIENQSRAIDQNTTSMKNNGQAIMALASNIEKMAIAQNKQAKQLQKIANSQRTYTKRLKESNHQGILATKYNRLVSNSFAVLRSRLLLAAFAMNMWRGSIGQLLKQSSDFQGSVNRINKGLETTGRAARETSRFLISLGDEIQENTGIAATEANEITALGLTFANIATHDIPNFTKTVMDMTVGLNRGVYSFETARSYAIILGKALNNPIEGISALTRTGVVLDNQQKQQIETFARFGDIASAQRVILDALHKEYGDKSSMEGYEKTMRSMTAAVNDLAKAIGEDFAPHIEKIANALTDFVKETDADDIYNFGAQIATTTVQVTALRYGLAGILTVLTNYSKWTNAATGALAAYLFQTGKAKKAITSKTVAIKLLRGAMFLLKGKLGILGVVGSLTGLSWWFNKGKKDADDFKDSLDDVSNATNNINTPNYTGGTDVTSQVPSIMPTESDRIETTMGNLRGLINDYNADLKKLNKTLSGYQDEQKSSIPISNKFEKELALMSYIILGTTEAMDKLNNGMKQGDKEIFNFADSSNNTGNKVLEMGEALQQVIQDTGNSEDAFLRLDRALETLAFTGTHMEGGMKGFTKEFKKQFKDIDKDVLDAANMVRYQMSLMEKKGKIGASNFKDNKHFRESLAIVQDYMRNLKGLGANEDGTVTLLSAIFGVDAKELQVLEDSVGLLVTGTRAKKRFGDVTDVVNQHLDDEQSIRSNLNKNIEDTQDKINEVTKKRDAEQASLNALIKTKEASIETNKKEEESIGKVDSSITGLIHRYDLVRDKSIDGYIKKLKLSNFQAMNNVQTFDNQFIPILMKFGLHMDKVSGKPLLDKKGMVDTNAVLKQFREFASIDEKDMANITKYANKWNQPVEKIFQAVQAGKQLVAMQAQLAKDASEADILAWSNEFGESVDSIKSQLQALGEGGYLTKALDIEDAKLDVTYIPQLRELLKVFEQMRQLQPIDFFENFAVAMDTTKPILKEYIDTFFQLSDAITSAFNSSIEMQRQRINDSYSERMAIAESIRNQKVRELYERKAQKAKEKEEAKLFKKHQANQKAMAIIAGAKGMLNVWMEPAPAGMDFGTAAILRGIQMGIIGASTIQQLANIDAQKSFALGGYVSGPRHSRGGVNANLEGGEFIMSRKAVNEFGVEELERMNRRGREESKKQIIVNVNFTGNINSSDFIEDEVIPTIRDAIARGEDIGV